MNPKLFKGDCLFNPLKENTIMTKKKTLLNERVIRRWGKLANMAPLTENWLEEQEAKTRMS